MSEKSMKAIDIEKLNTLVEINSLINLNYTDINALLIYILESAMRLVKCESSSILMLHEPDNTLRFEVALGPKGIEAKGIIVAREGSIAGWVIEHNQSIVIDDVSKDPRLFTKVQDQTGYITRTMIAVPLRVDNVCIGVLELINKKEGKTFTESDLQIIELLSTQASIAYNNAQTYTQAQKEISVLQTAVNAGPEYHTFIAESKPVLDLLSVIDRAAETNSSVLILGESGVGKELFAEQLHLKSSRRKKPFIRVNCAALSPQLLESELFGHVKGAFTDASQNRLGRFEAADGGTIFLDEIGELPLEVQVKLLRVIQSKTFEKVGSSTTQKVDVRIIAATNRNLEEMVAEGRFRSDLYYRLNVLPLLVPPLRNRKDDIKPLALFFCRKFSSETKKDFTGFTKEALNSLYSYYWPGNVRELENSIERACVLGKPPLITERDLLLQSTNHTETQHFVNFDLQDKTLKTVMNECKKNYIIKILEEVQWNQTEAAKVLDVQRTYVSKLIKDLQITL